MLKIGIIGANSYIARNMLHLWKKTDIEVEIKLYDSADNQVDGETAYKKINILDKESVKQIDMNCDLLYMFVGKTGSADGFENYDMFIDINERALLNVLNEYREQKSTAKIIFPSTRLVYKGAKHLLAEDAPKEFKTIYAINKFACEQYLEQFSRVYGVRYCIFRICVPYGTLISGASSYGTAEFMLSKATSGKDISLYGDGSVRRTITHMEDLCHVLVYAAQNEKCINDVYNIGGENYSLNEMAQMIAAKYGVGITYIDYPRVAEIIESGDTVFDDSKLKSVCKIQYKRTFEEWCKESKT